MTCCECTLSTYKLFDQELMHLFELALDPALATLWLGKLEFKAFCLL